MDNVELEKALEDKLRHINEFRDDYANSYYTYDKKHWDSDEKSRIDVDQAMDYIKEYSAVANPGGGLILPPNFPSWTDADNEDIEIPNPMYFYGLKNKLINFRAIVHGVSRYHKQTLRALATLENTTVEQISMYDFSQGWPSRDVELDLMG